VCELEKENVMVVAREAKGWAFENLRGMFVSPLTIFHDDGSLDEQGLASDVDYLIEQIGVQGLGYGHGEPWSLSHAERKETTEHFLRAVDGRVHKYIHAFDHSAPDTADFANHAAEHGADLVMIEPPYEWAKSEAHILEYYTYVADHTDVGIILLNTPHSGRIMSGQLLDKLADIPAVCAIKDGINDWATARGHWEIVHDRIVFSLPREEEALSCLMYLKQQVQLGTSAVFCLQTPDWQPVRQYVELAYEGRYEDAFRIWAALGPLRELWSSMHTVLWSANAEHPIVWAKAWMEVMGMTGGPIRAPGQNLDAETKAAFQQRIRETLEMTRNDPIFSDESLKQSTTLMRS
jgi:4-hydroxy-tetrahydrodipicolinate synthase